MRTWLIWIGILGGCLDDEQPLERESVTVTLSGGVSAPAGSDTGCTEAAQPFSGEAWPVEVTTTSDWFTLPEVGRVGATLGAAWQELGSLHVAPIDDSGVPLEVSAVYALEGPIAWGDQGVTVPWTKLQPDDLTGEDFWDLYLTRITLSGDGINLHSTQRWDVEPRMLALEPMEGGYGLLYQVEVDEEVDALMFVELDLDGEPLGVPVGLAEGWVGLGEHSVVRTGSSWAFLWVAEAARPWDQDLVLRQLDEDGLLTDPVVLDTSDGFGPRAPALAWTGKHLGVIYRDIDHDEGHRIRLTLLTQDGEEVWTRIVADDDAGYYPHMVWNGSEFGVAWMPLTFARVSEAGELLQDPLTLPWDDAMVPLVSWAADRYALGWSTWTESEGYRGQLLLGASPCD